MEGGGQVDRDDLVPLLDREILDRRDVLDAGIVDQDVDAAEGLLRASPTMAAISAGFVMSARRVERLDAELLLDAGALGLDRGRVAEAVDDDVGALLGEAPGRWRGRCRWSIR